MMQPILLVRPEFMTKYELRFAQEHFPVVTRRTACQGTLVIGRYSVLPFYHEVSADLTANHARLINSPAQHEWIASFAYYHALREFTPDTWTQENLYLSDHPGPFVVKGALTSKKWQWNHQMFASTRQQAMAIADQLREDTWIGDQEILYRRYVPLRTFGHGKNGVPYTNEWRFFYLRDQRLCYGYYWAISDCLSQAEMTPVGLQLADQVARIAAKHATFFTLDIAETEAGDWILIEINDGQMSQLCENDPEEFYLNLSRASAALARGES